MFCPSPLPHLVFPLRLKTGWHTISTESSTYVRTYLSVITDKICRNDNGLTH
ncbi:unnamed protein product [Linum tenue]|uniref:Uncharacterized protein n=1 Tax=Linum tenue TaxID=586396 RepID=A0AAV0K006_9ROSI|nr:unnamed protein product [Linum tenue]